MGSLDIPPFLREQAKQKAAAAAQQSGSEMELPSFLKKKDGTQGIGNESQSGTIQTSQSSSNSQSQSKESEIPTFDFNKGLHDVDESSLDIIEKNNLQKKLPPIPAGFTPEQKKAAINEVIQERRSPVKQYANAMEFLSQDMDNSPDVVNSLAEHPQKFKEQVLLSDAPNNIDITTYVNERLKGINEKIQLAKNQYDIAFSDAKGRRGWTGDENWAKIDEYQQQVQSLEDYKSNLEKYSTQLLKTQVVKNTPLPKDASPDSVKNYFRDIGVGVNAIDNPDYTRKKTESIKTDSDKIRNQEIVQLEDYRAASQGIEAMRDNIEIEYGTGGASSDEYEYKMRMDALKMQQKKLFDYYPKAKEVAEYQAIGQELESLRNATDALDYTGQSSLFHNLISSGYSDAQVRDVATKFGKSEQEIKDIINKKDDIPGTSFLGNVYNKFIARTAQNLIDPIRSVIDKGRLRTDAEIEDSRYERDKQFQLSESQQFDAPVTIRDTHPTIIDEDKASPTYGKKIANPNYLQEINNPNEGNHNWGYGAINRVGDAIGGLGELWVTTAATAGLGDFALGGKIGAEVVGIGQKLQKINRLTAQQKNLFGNVVGMTLLGYNDNKIQGVDAGMDEDVANLYALTRGMETGLVFGLGVSPQNLFKKAIGAEEKAAAKSFAEMIPKDGVANLNKAKWADYLKNNLITRLGIEGLEENAKVSATMAVDQAVGFATQSMFAPQSVEKRNLGNEMLDEGIKNFLTFAPISFLGASVSALKNPHKDQSKIEQEAIYRMGLTPQRYADYATGQAETGKISQQDANNRIQLVNTMGSIISGGLVPKELSRSEKVEYSNNLLHSYKLSEQIKTNTLPQEQVELKEAQIEELKNRRAEILKNSNGVEVDDNGKPLIRNEAPAPKQESITIDGEPATRAQVEEIISKGKAEVDKYDIEYSGSDEALHSKIQEFNGGKVGEVSFSPKSREVIHSERVPELFNELSEKEEAKPYLDPNDKQGSIEQMQSQALTTPNSIKNVVGEKLAVELISRNSAVEINKQIDTWAEKAAAENVTPQEQKDADNHIKLLEKGLEEKAKVNEASVLIKEEPVSAVSSEPQRLSQENTKAGDIVYDAEGNEFEVVGFGKSRKGNDVVEVKTKSSDGDLLEAAQKIVWARNRAYYPAGIDAVFLKDFNTTIKQEFNNLKQNADNSTGVATIALEDLQRNNPKQENKPIQNEPNKQNTPETNEPVKPEEVKPSKTEPIEDSSGAEPVKEERNKEFDKMTSSIPNGGEVKKYLSGDTIKKYEEGTELRNNQEIISQELEPALKHGVETIEKAKEIYGDKYVGKTLDYIERENIAPENKALLYVSLENDMAKRVLAEPDNLGVKKLQDLVRTKSQAYLRSNSLAINMGRLRKFAETGYDITKVTDRFFSSKEKEEMNEVEKNLQADAGTIQKQYEENIKQDAAAQIDVEAKIKEGVESEIAKLYEALPKEKKTAADKAIAALDRIHEKLRSKTYESTIGVPVAIIDAGVVTIRAAIKAGVKIADAIELGIGKIKEKYGKDWAKEDEFRKDVLSGLKEQGYIDKEQAKKNKREYRMLETERNRQLAKVGELKDKLGRLERGEETIADVRERIKDVPEIEDLKQQVKDKEAEVSKAKSEEKRIADNVAKLEAELLRAKERRSKEPKYNVEKVRELTDAEKDLNEQIGVEKEKWQKEKDNAKQFEKDYRALEAERNRQIEKVEALKDKLESLQKGERPAVTPKSKKVDTPEIEDLKIKVVAENKRLNELDAQRSRIETLEKELSRLEDRREKEPSTSTPKVESQREKDLKALIDVEREKIRAEVRDEKLFGDEPADGKTQSERLADAKDRINQQIEDIRKEIANKQRINVPKSEKLKADQELTRLMEDKVALEKTRDAYLPKDKDLYADKKEAERIKDRLVKEVEYINKQINEGVKDIKGDKKPLSNTEIEKLKAEKELRQSILEAVDPTPREYVKNALIENGFGKTIKVKTKNGVEERQVLDWTKLAGEEGSVDNISKHVAKSLEKSGFTQEQLDRMSDAFISEYTDVRKDVIEKGLNEVAARNKTTVAADQKSAAKKLAEMYNYGLFDKNLVEYETVLAKTIGVNKLNPERLKQVVELADAMSSVLSSEFKGNKLTERQARAAIQVVEEKMRYILNAEANEHGSTALKIADTVQAYMDLAQRMTLNSLKQAAENPLSGKWEDIFSTLGTKDLVPKELNKEASKMSREIYKEMVLEKGAGYGEVQSAFINRGNVEKEIDRMPDNKVLQGVLSTAIGKTTLDAVDSMFKSKITQQKFIYNLIQVLTKDRVVNGKIEKGMSKQEAQNYVAEKISGQSFKDAQTTAKEIIDKVNKDAGKKIFNDSDLFVNRLAHDIVTAALINGEKVTSDMVDASYNAAYKAAGRGLGHVANNIISRQVGSVTGELESRYREQVKQKDYRNAAVTRWEAMIFRNIINPFVGGGSNWIVLKAEKTGLGLLSGIASSYKYRNSSKIDMTSDVGMKNLEDAMYQQMKTRDKLIRGAVGGIATALTALAIGGVMSTDEYRKWRNKNTWASKYIDLVTPEILLASMAKDDKKLDKYLQGFVNKNEQTDKGLNTLKAIKAFATGDETASAKTGALFGSMVGAPVPWRLVRDGDQLWTGLAGGEPYKISNDKPETFWQGFFKGGLADRIGLAPHPENNWLTNEDLKTPSFKVLTEKGIEPPKIGSVKQIKVDIDKEHPDGVMTDKEYAEYTKKMKEALVKAMPEILDNTYEVEEKKSAEGEPEYKQVKGKDLDNDLLKAKISDAKEKASKEIKEEMGLTKQTYKKASSY